MPNSNTSVQLYLHFLFQWEVNFNPEVINKHFSTSIIKTVKHLVYPINELPRQPFLSFIDNNIQDSVSGWFSRLDILIYAASPKPDISNRSHLGYIYIESVDHVYKLMQTRSL